MKIEKYRSKEGLTLETSPSKFFTVTKLPILTIACYLWKFLEDNSQVYEDSISL